MVELELKLYIREALTLVAKLLAGRMPFKMSGTDFEEAPLERLIETFKKLSNNGPLVTKLNKFKKHRNFVAHKAIAECLDPDGELMRTETKTFSRRLEIIQDEAVRLVDEIHQELLHIVVHVEFDAIN